MAAAAHRVFSPPSIVPGGGGGRSTDDDVGDAEGDRSWFEGKLLSLPPRDTAPWRHGGGRGRALSRDHATTPGPRLASSGSCSAPARNGGCALVAKRRESYMRRVGPLSRWSGGRSSARWCGASAVVLQRRWAVRSGDRGWGLLAAHPSHAPLLLTKEGGECAALRSSERMARSTLECVLLVIHSRARVVICCGSVVVGRDRL